MSRLISRARVKQWHKVLNIAMLIVIAMLTTQTMAQAKSLDILDILSGGFEAGDTISAPVVVDLKTVEAPKQALKYSGTGGIKTTVEMPIPTTATSTASFDGKSTTTALAPKTSKKTTEEDDLDFTTSSSSISGTHASTSLFGNFSFPSWGSNSSSVAYTTDTASLRSSLNTPEVALSYMSTNFTYSNHDGNTPYTPETFNYYKTGDCKDYATFFGWALADDGWPVYTYDYQYASSSGHVISVYQGSDGNWYAQSNSSSIGPVSSAQDAFAQTMPSGGTLGSYREFAQGYTGAYSWK
ncbi:hypothetical protein [Desulfovibrio sp. DV]|uniref:hypothetical protein n=1 Tax=Desulfovibrio sp. DV TaxID=1844708 RepID=UPI000A94A6D0|nr:hypothetical protein [Desulfovibrio sp. DV]